MLGKPHYYEKVVDIALGLGELYRIENHQVGLDQIVREFKLSTSEEAEEILFLCRLNQKITHHNLIKIYAFNFEDLQMEGDDPESVKEDKINNLLSKAKQLEKVQLAQMRLLEKLSKNPNSLNEKDDLDCFEEFKIRQIQKKQTFSKDNRIDVIDQTIALRKARRVQYIVKVAMEDVPCTLATEIQRRKDEGIAFRLQDVVSFLKDSINLFASLQFHNQEMRDIYPQNIFVSYTRTGATPHFLFGVSQEHLKFYRKRGTEGSQRFSKLFARALGYLAPELKESYFKLCFCNSKDEYPTSKAGVFSLGLIALQMASFEDTWGLNFSNDEVIQKKIKKLIKQVRIKHSNYLASFLESMLEFDPNKRMDFLELDSSLIYQQLLAENPEFMTWTVTFNDDKAINQLKENLVKFQTHCREIERYESQSDETTNIMLQLFQHPCKNLQTIRFISSPVSIPMLSSIIRSQPLLLSLELNSAESFSSDHMLFILRNYSHLKTLKLIKCGINPALIQLFQTYPLPQSLKILDLSCNPEIGDRGFKIILFKIKFHSLKVLRLGGISAGCSLTLESLRAIYHLAGDQRKIPTDHFFGQLKIFDISWNPIDEKGLNYVCMHYMLFKHLKELDFTRCNFLPENLSETSSYSQKQKIAKNIKLA